MKHYFTILISGLTVLTLSAQDIKNTLGTNGNFVVETISNSSLATISSSDGSVTVNSLAGAGERNLKVDATGKLVAGSAVGGLILSVNLVTTASYTATATDYTMIPIVDGTTITVPDASTVLGRVYVIKLSGNTDYTVNITSPDPNDRFDGALGIQLDSGWEFVQIQAATNEAWIVIGGNGYTLTN